MTRQQRREASAEYLNALSRDELFHRFEITRTAKISGLDIIGVPVYSCARPASKTLSVSAGKSRIPEMARAGAIAEGIEFYTFENPRGPYLEGYCSVENLPTMDSFEFSMRHEKPYTNDMPILVEPATKWSTGKPVMFPSEMIWLQPRELKQKLYFMKSTNGQAVGSSVPDAFLQGLYEVVERDQVGLWRISMERMDAMPPRAEIPERLQEIERACTDASLKLYLFGCHVDIPIPTFWAMLVDPYTQTGTFNGWGCHLSNEVAAERAILEAIQSRAVYISGARDDITRHEFKTNQELDPQMIMEACDPLPLTPFPEEVGMNNLELDAELALVLTALKAHHDKIYYKPIRIDEHLWAVKTIITDLEHPNLINLIQGWRSTRWEKLRQQWIASSTQALVSTG